MRTSDLKKLLGTEKLVLGTDRTLKAVRQGRVARILLAKNAPSSLRESLDRCQRFSSFELEVSPLTNDELGTLCKKPFSVAVIAILS